MNIKLSILKSLLDVVSTISDLKYQERVWIKGLGPECSSFEETMCNFFDDFNAEEILINYKEYNISDKQYQILLKFYNRLRKFSDKTPSLVHEENIIFDPKWTEIRKLAKDVLKVFDYKKTKYL